MITDQEYEDANLLKKRNLSDINDLCNFENMIIFCEIFDSRATLRHKKYGLNLRRCNSASTLSKCIQYNQSKIIIALPTDSKTVKLFEKTFMSGFSCANTHRVFDTNILMPNVKPDLANESQYRKRKDLKIVYSLRLKDDEKYQNYRVVSKMDKNNQYGQAITKPLPTGCIKNKKRFPAGVNLTLSLTKFLQKTKLVTFLLFT